MIRVKPIQSLKIQPKKLQTTDPEEIKQKFNDLVESHVFQSSQISIESNFNGYVAKDISINAGDTARIEHYLGVVPKWRIILKQEGNGVISDIPSEWTNKYITLKNNGAEKVIISVLIARE